MTWSSRCTVGPVRCVLALTVMLGAPGVQRAEPPTSGHVKTPPPFAPDSTYAKRVADSPWNKPLEAPSLVYPHPHALNVMPGPAVWKAGRKLRLHPDADTILWDGEPTQKIHAEYLAKRKELIPKKQDLALVAWCERNGLALAAEFELRRLLCFRTDVRDMGYQAIRRRWSRYADKRQIASSFPLPVEGEWFVVVDRTGHHRLKHGAAYAWDLMVKKNGRMHKGSIRKLENHHAWGRPVFAQADGVVIAAQSKHPDMPIGKIGGFANANDVVVDYGGGIRALYGHLQQNSVKVKVGQKVTAGQVLGRVGNSGASGMPHLHFTFLDSAHFSIKGRFRCQVQSLNLWKPHDAKDLRGGITVRNVPDADKP